METRHTQLSLTVTSLPNVECVAKISMMSSVVIKMQTRYLLACETERSSVHLNNKNNCLGYRSTIEMNSSTDEIQELSLLSPTSSLTSLRT